MRILIADDEKLSRESLKIMLTEYESLFEIVGEAENGEELVNMTLKLKPDIVFVDIRMPKLDGLEAIRQLRGKLKYTQWIILTGFSEFEYAKKALQLGVSNYLLKPIDPEELFKALNEMTSHWRNRISIRNSDFEKKMIGILMGLNDGSASLSIFEKTLYSGLVTYSDSYLDSEQRKRKKAEYYERLRCSISSLLDNNAEIGILPLHADCSAVVYAYNAENQTGLSEYEQRLIFKIKQCILAVTESSFVITTVELEKRNSFPALLKEIEQVGSISSIRSVARIGNIFSLGDFQRWNKAEAALSLSRLLMQMKTHYDDHDSLNFTKDVADFETLFYTDAELNTLCRSNVLKFLNTSLSCGISPDTDNKVWHLCLAACGKRLYSAAPKLYGGAIEQVKNYIEKNYMNDISIAEISDTLHMTPNYLSSLFHKKTGMTFKKYLTNIRMLKAKQILENPGCKVQQVAKSVGYYSTRYFSKIFKSYYNYYPSDSSENKTESASGEAENRSP